MKYLQAAICKTIEGVPGEIQIIPYGRHETGKGAFVLDEEGMAAIIADFDSRENDMVIDYEHQTLSGGEAPAAGWIKKLLNKGREGLWAVVEWTPRAIEYLKNREYRYLSPAFLKTISEGKVVKLINAGLTNDPAIDGMVPVVNKDVKTTHKEGQKMLKKLIKLLALKEDATEEQALEAVKGLAGEAKVLAALKEPLGMKAEATADEAMQVVAAMKASLEAYEAGSKNIKSVMAAHTEVMQALGLKEGASLSEVKGAVLAMKQGSEQTGDLAKEVAALRDKLAQRDAEEMVAAAMKEGKITPASERWARDYAAKDPEGFKAFVAKAPQVVPTGERAGGDGPSSGGGIEGTQLAVNKALGIDEETFKKHNPAKE